MFFLGLLDGDLWTEGPNPMNPYADFSDVLFTCVDAPHSEIANTMLEGFNRPEVSNAEELLSMEGVNEVRVFAEGVPKIYRRGDPMPPKIRSSHYFLKEVALDFSLAYVNHAERDGTKTHRVILWEPRLHPGTTVVMGRFHDGMCSSVSAFSIDNPHSWVNVRIYDDADYPGSFFEYYADFS